jgi:hypothetical protein
LNRFQTLPDKKNGLLSFLLLDIAENYRKRPIDKGIDNKAHQLSTPEAR